MANAAFQVIGTRAKAVERLNAKLDASGASPELKTQIKQLLGTLAQGLPPGPVQALVQFNTDMEPMWVTVSLSLVEIAE